MTARTEDAPETHNGADAFTFRILFSEEIKIKFTYFRDHSLEVTGGSVTGAQGVDGRRDLWEITVEPDSNADVSIALPADRPCDEGAICTSDGRRLSNALVLTVGGPGQQVRRRR